MSVSPSEARARRLLARLGKKLREYSRVVQPNQYRAELSAMADTIRDELALPPGANPAEQPDEDESH